MELRQIQNVCSSKDTVKKMKKQAKSWLKNILANHILVKEIVCRIHEKQNNLVKREAKDLNKRFTKGGKEIEINICKTISLINCHRNSN